MLSSSGSGLPSPSQQWLRNARQECCALQGAGEGGDGYHLKTMSLCSQPAAVTQGHAWVCTAARPTPPRLLPHLAPTRPGSASSKASYYHVMFLQNQGWEHPMNQCQAPPWVSSSSFCSSSFLRPAPEAGWGLCAEQRDLTSTHVLHSGQTLPAKAHGATAVALSCFG